jgi:hypothetical protein
MFGGAFQGTLIDELLAWDGSSWQTYSATLRPPARRQPSLTYDIARERVVVFSGYGSGSTVLGDLWEWNGTVWVSRPVAPSPRTAQVTFDYSRSRLLMIGGSSPPQSFTDAWEFDGGAGVWTQRADFGPPFIATGLGVYVPSMGHVVFPSGSGLTVWDGNASVISPWITSQPSGATVPAGESISLGVATGGGPSNYQWQKGGAPVFNGGSVSGATTATLTISPLATTDTGSYRVLVSNVCGAVTSQPAYLFVPAPCSGLGCYANCDQSTACPTLSANDFQCFLNRFAAGNTWANCDGSSNQPVLNANDFLCYLNVYAAGCS